LSSWRGGRAGRHACVAIAAITLLFPALAAWSQSVQPDRRISSQTTLHGFPTLAVSGNRALSSWLGPEAPNDGVGYSYSLDAGLSWANETGLPVLPPFRGVSIPSSACLTPNGTVHLVTDNLGIQYFRGIGFNPIVWENPLVALDVYTTSAFLGYDQQSLECDPALGYVYLCATEGTDFSNNAGSTILFTRSLDNGSTWQSPLRLSSPNCKGPSVAVGADGTLYVTYVDYALGQVLLQKSTDHGASFLPPLAVASMLDNLGVPPLGWRLALGAQRVYPYYLDSGLAPNFPALAVDKSPGPTRGNLYLTWAEYAAGTVSPAASLVGDAGNNHDFDTAQPVPLDSDITGFLPGFEFGQGEVDYFVFQGTAGHTVWISGSASDGGRGSSLQMELPDGSRPLVSKQVLLDPNAIVGPHVALPTIYTLPRTGRYFLSLGSGPGDASYLIQLRTYTAAPTSVARDMRDIVLVRSTDGGAKWSAKQRVNHDAAGTDQAMPNVAVDAHGDVYVAWYDRRDGAAGDSVQAYASVSGDGGQTFGRDLKLSSRGSAWLGAPDPAFGFLLPGDLVGDRIAVAAGDDFGIVAWVDLRDWPIRSDIYAARIIDAPTAVSAVSDLEAEPIDGGVRLSWHVNDLRNIAGLRVFRAADDSPEAPLGEAELIPSREGVLDYLDTTAEPGRTYNYRLRVRAGAQVDWLGPVTVQLPARVTALKWRAAWPNPFARRTSVKLAVPHEAVGTVRVYDVQGKEVRTLSAGRFAAGEHVLEWDGRDASGGMAAPGLYFLTAHVGGERTQLRVARVP
jgi:flagellar hook capping protein FlgD